MSERKHNKLIDHIRESLYEHEEPYSPGAWEAFQQHRKKKASMSAGKVAFSVAASLALVLAGMFVLNNFAGPAHEQPVAEHQKETNIVSADTSADQPEPAVPGPEPNDSAIALYAKAPVKTPEPADSSEEGEVVKATSPSVVHPRLSGILHLPTPALLASGTISPPPGPRTAAEHPEANNQPLSYREPHQRRVVETNRGKNISFGLAYAPLINSNDTETDWSMGGGLYTEWKFARNLSLSSGVLIAQNQLEYDRKTSMEGAGAENLAYVQVDLVSLEIPLNLRYYLTDHISVSAGISSSAFLKESYNYTYEYQREVQILSYKENSGIKPVSRLVTFTKADKQSEPSFNSMDWAAFYTFSLGYQYEIANKHTLSLEPFVKLPSGHLTTRNIKYYTGGFQLKFSF